MVVYGINEHKFIKSGKAITSYDDDDWRCDMNIKLINPIKCHMMARIVNSLVQNDLEDATISLTSYYDHEDLMIIGNGLTKMRRVKESLSAQGFDVSTITT